MSTGQTLALFGTSADPPSTGHRALLEGLLDHYPQVVTWASSNPFKQHGAPLGLRAALLQAPGRSKPWPKPSGSGQGPIRCLWWAAIWSSRSRAGTRPSNSWASAGWRWSPARAGPYTRRI